MEYEAGNKIRPITFSNKSEDYVKEIPGSNCDWDENEHGIIIRGECEVTHPDVLYDPKQGIAFDDAILGIAAIISSPDSYQRRTFTFDGELENDSSSRRFSFSVSIPAGTIRSSFSIRTVLFLKSPSRDTAPDYYDNNSGSILASIGPATQIFIDSNSSEFPTVSAKDGRQNPLWKLEVTWTDPLKDSFLDSVSLVINSDHPDYNKMDLDRDKKNVAMLNEIYSSAILQIILKLKLEEDQKTWKDMMDSNSDAVYPGSVCDYIGYMLKEILRCDGEDIFELSYNLRKKIHGGFQ